MSAVALLSLVLAGAVVALPSERAQASLGEHRKLVWSDEFDELDFDTWEHEITMSGGGNWEFQYYTNNRTNSYVRDGVLYLRPTLTADTIGEANLVNGGTLDLNGDSHSVSSCTDASFFGCSRSSNGQNIINPVQSASVKTISSFSTKYGTVEIRAKLPKGDWLWPAIWMLPTQDKYGRWPASGEIDIVESRGNSAEYPLGGVNSFGTTLHWGPFFPEDRWDLTHATTTLDSGDFSEDFHVFGLTWTADRMTTYLDDPNNVVLDLHINQTFWNLGGWGDSLFNPWSTSNNTNAPFDQKFFLKFNVAVGGVTGFFPDTKGKPWKNQSPTAMLDFWNAKDKWYNTWKGEDAALQVDWVHVYA